MVSTIGVLALQGDVSEHMQAVEACGARAIAVRYARQIEHIDALIIPGGESTTIAKLTADNRDAIFDAICDRIKKGMPVYGTCMGSIFLAKEIEGSTQGRLAAMDIKVRRNAFGPQKFSFETMIEIPELEGGPFCAVFIRGPAILSCASSATPMAYIRSGVGQATGEAGGQRYIVMARQGNLLVTSFHPELTDDRRIHRYFLKMVEASKASRSPVAAAHVPAAV